MSNPERHELTLRERMQREDWNGFYVKAVRFAAGFRCQLCGKRFPYPGLGLHVHHNTYERLGHEKMSDLIALCGAHHALIEYAKKYLDLFDQPLTEMLGIIDETKDRIENVEEAFEASVFKMSETLDALRDQASMLLSATDAGRWADEWRKRRDAG